VMIEHITSILPFHSQAACEQSKMMKTANKGVHLLLPPACAVLSYAASRGVEFATCDKPDRPRGGTCPVPCCDAEGCASPLPQWMRSTRPMVGAGMALHGPLIVLAVLAAASGILSTVLALASL
jgi:hypothetical protein